MKKQINIYLSTMFQPLFLLIYMFILLYLITSFLNIFVFYIWPITLILFISQYYYTFLIYYFNKIFFHPPQRCHSRENGNPVICHYEERSKPAPAKAGEAISYFLFLSFLLFYMSFPSPHISFPRKRESIFSQNFPPP